MAEKGGDKVRKGFFFYLFIFMLILVGAFAICVVVMLFNPGKEVLGLKYFSGNYSQVHVKTTDGSDQDLNIGTAEYDEIVINMDYGKAVIQRTTDYKQDGVVIINRAKGFTTSGSDISFKPVITIKDNVLSINIEHQPEGFLFFSRDVQVIIHMADVVDDKDNHSDSRYSNAFAGTKFTINTKGADVEIGSGKNAGYTRDVYVNMLDVSTTSGNINFNAHAPEIFVGLNIKTKTGKVAFAKNSVKILFDTNLDIGGGVLRLKELYVQPAMLTETVKYSANITVNGGTFSAEKLACGSANFEFSSGRIEVGTLSGNANFIPSSEIISKGNVSFKEILGDFAMPVGNDVNVYVGSAKNIYCATTAGSITANSNGVMNLTTTSGAINSSIGTSSSSRTISSQTGKINLTFDKGIYGNKNVVMNQSGAISISFVNSSKAKFSFEYPEEASEKQFDMSKVNFDILESSSVQENPYYYNCTDTNKTGEISVKTNGRVDLALIA